MQYSPTIEHPLGASLPASAGLNPSNVPYNRYSCRTTAGCRPNRFLESGCRSDRNRGGRFRRYHAPKTVKLDFRS